MTCATCPNCGYQMEKLERFEAGHLAITDGGASIRWRGRPVHLTPSQRVLIIALARAEGVPVKRIALAEAMGSDEAQDPENVVDVQVSRAIRTFRQVDPAFDAVQNVRGCGLRWAA